MALTGCKLFKQQVVFRVVCRVTQQVISRMTYHRPLCPWPFKALQVACTDPLSPPTRNVHHSFPHAIKTFSISASFLTSLYRFLLMGLDSTLPLFCSE